MKMEGWQLDHLAKGYHWKTLINLLSSDPVLQILKPKLIGEIKGPIPLSAGASNTLEEIAWITRLPHEANLVAGVFDANKLMKCDQDEVTYAY